VIDNMLRATRLVAFLFYGGDYMVRDSLGGRNMFRPYIEMFLKLSITYFATTISFILEQKFIKINGVWFEFSNLNKPDGKRG